MVRLVLPGGTVRASVVVHAQVPDGIVKVVVDDLSVAQALLTSDSLHDAAVTCAWDKTGHNMVSSVIRNSFLFMVSSAL
jgi:hypothetical protein